MRDSLPTDKDHILWILMAQTRAAMLKARERELEPYRITSSQSAVLFILEALGDRATPKEIARWLPREPHSVSELLSRMEKQGLVRKIKEASPSNRVRILLTQKGREASSQAGKRECVHRILSCLSEEEHQQLRSLLRKLRDKALREIRLEMEIPFPLSK